MQGGAASIPGTSSRTPDVKPYAGGNQWTSGEHDSEVSEARETSGSISSRINRRRVASLRSHSIRVCTLARQSPGFRAVDEESRRVLLPSKHSTRDGRACPLMLALSLLTRIVVSLHVEQLRVCHIRIGSCVPRPEHVVRFVFPRCPRTVGRCSGLEVECSILRFTLFRCSGDAYYVLSLMRRGFLFVSGLASHPGWYGCYGPSCLSGRGGFEGAVEMRDHRFLSA